MGLYLLLDLLSFFRSEESEEDESEEEEELLEDEDEELPEELDEPEDLDLLPLLEAFCFPLFTDPELISIPE